MKSMPFRATTATGDIFDFTFALHEDTVSAVRVSQLVSMLLDTLDKDIATMGETSNGDVLQALAMALAIRARMIHASTETIQSISLELLQNALAAVAQAERQSPPSGRA